jgi:hypothetical protein
MPDARPGSRRDGENAMKNFDRTQTETLAAGGNRDGK